MADIGITKYSEGNRILSSLLIILSAFEFNDCCPLSDKSQLLSLSESKNLLHCPGYGSDIFPKGHSAAHTLLHANEHIDTKGII
ncbi:hypothetical protein [Methanobrevibacter sp. DSM 116169]|uniref:hypothetical protein n=1 Tax=Methanobrevibacter sp. DSM 116169 TaxID=3242727 RepID=UPI0038FCF65E